ncbi:MAG: tetratricopeptide repeat protein [Phototrophicaceae bacterium]
MGFFRRISQLFSNSQKPSEIPNAVLLGELMDKARRSQYAEKFDEALGFLSEAMEIAKSEHNTRTQVDITLSRGDILITQKDFETARFVLNELRDDAQSREMQAPYAYSLCSLGVLEKTLGNLSTAQSNFEQAREIAEKINTDGAYGRATAHLAEIYLAQDNANYAIYLLEDAIPKLDRSGDRELLAYFIAQLGVAQIHSGHSEQGQISLERALALATTIKHQGQLRYINTILGEESLKKADYASAEGYLIQAYEQSPVYVQDTADYTQLLANLSKINLRLDKPERAQVYAEKALPLAQDLSDSSLIAMAKAVLGLAMRANKDPNAITYLEEAVEAYETVEVDSFTIDILRRFASTQISAGQIEQGITSYREAINKSENLPFEAGQAHSDLATYYASQYQYREALQEWQHALSQFESANQVDYQAQARCNIALMYESLGDGRMAQREYGKSLEMLTRIDNPVTRGNILEKVALAYSNFGDVESAQDFFKEALEIAQENDNQVAEALRLGNYGRLLALTNQTKQALPQIMQAQKISKDLGLELHSAMMLNNLGLAYSIMNQHESAIEQYESALEQLKTLNSNQWIAQVRANMGDSFQAKNDFTKANDYYDSAYALAKPLNVVEVLIQVFIGQALNAIYQDDLETAQQKLVKAEPLAKRLNYRRLLALHAQAKSRLYAKQNKPDEALSAWENAKKIRHIMQMPPITPDWL